LELRNGNLSDQNKTRLSFIITWAYYAVIILLSFLFFKYLLGSLLPFISAFLIVSISRRFILRLEELCKSKRFASGFFTILLIAFLSLVLYGICLGLFRELTALSSLLTEDYLTDFFLKATETIQGFLGKLSKTGFISERLDSTGAFIDGLGNALSGSISAFVPKLISLLVKFLSFFPSAVIFISFMFISMFYISHDYEKICRFLLMQLPEKFLDTLDETKSIISSTAYELFKAYFLLTFITFLQLLIGFMIIGINYATLLAAVICFIDLLPILGTGTVIIPWSGICFMLGDIRTSIGLMVLYASITLFRQLAQPKIIGSNVGLPPLVSLISIFAGLKIMGFLGIIVFPLIATTVIKLNSKGFLHLYKEFPKKSGAEISKTKRKFINFKKNDISPYQGSDDYDEYKKDD